MSRRVRLALMLGCLGVSALHLPRAARAARTGFAGYAEPASPTDLAQSQPERSALHVALDRGGVTPRARAGS